ncbi:MAG: type IV secretion system DNA-binding domain-containing protein [Candidatus Gracilibacteria bacterium]|nr:type IV secretion system DNA-binding domain-containing protein [Candidatus Gracilibacteria bacterium]
MNEIGKTLEGNKFIFGLNYFKGEYFYSLSCADEIYSSIESKFYTSFNDFQIIKDEKDIFNYKTEKVVVGEIILDNSWFFPFKVDETEGTDFVFNLFRSFENFDVINDRFGIFIEAKPIHEEGIGFYFKSRFQFFFFKIFLSLTFFKYLFNFKTQKDWKSAGYKYFNEKIHKELFETKIYILAESTSKEFAISRIKAIFNNFLVFKNYPLNHFKLNIHYNILSLEPFISGNAPLKKLILTSEEITSFYHFPQNPKSETSLLKVTARKLALPIGVPTIDYKVLQNGEICPIDGPENMNVIGVSDYRSIRVPVGIYDEDRLRHTYVIGKTGVGKSKFLASLFISDIKGGKGIGIIDPHGDLFEEALMNIPESRKKDVIIFDPTDEKFPFCMNPLDIRGNESKQVLAKGFIDIFKKFFGANWNPKLEHVLRMIFLALLDKPGSTIFDIIRALTNKDFRYEMIEAIQDDVVKNFWTNEFAGWSQQFNTEAIMPILNKVGQLLSIDMIKNIFISKENKLDFKQMMDEGKILLVKLPKGKLQEEIMGFLGAMLITKIFQTSMSRQSEDKNNRRPFFLYVDEFQNFATETFNEILAEARKYGLGLTVAHQYIKQIPPKISESLFGNVGTLVSFRISSEDAIYMKQHFDPFIDTYDLANLSQREFYAKMIVKGQVKDPFSLRALYLEDPKVDKAFIEELYKISRSKYSRPLEEAKKITQEEQKDVIKKIEEFSEPII